MTIQLLRILRRNNLLPEEVEVVEELPERLKMRDKTSGIIFYIRKPMPKGKRIVTDPAGAEKKFKAALDRIIERQRES